MDANLLMQKCVSIIVPCRNELRHIESFCRSALAQELPSDWRLELIVADGMSDDGTRNVLTTLSAADSRIRWIDNPGRIVSTGLNRALAEASGEVIVRMDVHTVYCADYVRQCLAALIESGADNVGGPWRAQVDDVAAPVQAAIVAAFQSKWVAGGARSRQLGYDGWVDTVYLGCWPRASFSRFGAFDEALVRNQDDEHNLRITRGGGRIWQSSHIKSAYHPRNSLRQLFRQYFQYGYWKPFVMKKHGQAAALRQLAPPVFVAGTAILAAAGAVGGTAWPVAIWLLAYILAVVGISVATAWQAGLEPSAGGCLPVVIVTYHLSYGFGSLLGWWDVLRGRPARSRFAALTR